MICMGLLVAWLWTVDSRLYREKDCREREREICRGNLEGLEDDLLIYIQKGRRGEFG